MSNKIIRSIKDSYFDYPFSHELKSKIQSIISSGFSFSNEPNIKRTHRNYYVINKEPFVVITSEHIKDLQLFSEQIGKKNEATFLVYFWWSVKQHFLDGKYIRCTCFVEFGSPTELLAELLSSSSSQHATRFTPNVSNVTVTVIDSTPYATVIIESGLMRP
mgnify:CR=1 FL=1